MIINLGAVCIKYEDLLNVRVILHDGKYLVQATVLHQNLNLDVLPYDLYTAKDAQDAVRFMNEISEKNNCSLTRYYNEKINPPTLQLWPIQPENSQGVHGEARSADGHDATPHERGYVTSSPIENTGSDGVESRPCQA